MNVFYFLIELPETGQAMTWIGGGLKLSNRPGYVWLTAPDGRKLMEVPRNHITPLSKEDLANLLVEDRRIRKAALN